MEIKGPPVGYTDLLDFEIMEKQKKEAEERKAGNGKKSHPLRPSAAGYCARRLAYDLMEYRGHSSYEKKLNEPNIYRLFELGNAVEYQALKTFQLLKGIEQRYGQQILDFFEIERGAPDLPKEVCSGSCDKVFWSDKYKAIMDVKSKKDNFSVAYKSKWEEEIAKFSDMQTLIKLSETAFYAPDLDAFLEELDDDFLADNFYQLNLYALAEFMKVRGIDHAFLYRYNKNDSRHLEIRFTPSEKAFKYVQDKFNEVSKAVDQKRPDLIEKESILGTARCGFCPYQDQCWEQGEGLRAYLNTFPRKKWPQKAHEVSAELVEKLEAYEIAQKTVDLQEKLHEEICTLLDKEKINRVQLPNGNIYEMKHLKSPRPHFALRRSKL